MMALITSLLTLRVLKTEEGDDSIVGTYASFVAVIRVIFGATLKGNPTFVAENRVGIMF